MNEETKFCKNCKFCFCVRAYDGEIGYFCDIERDKPVMMHEEDKNYRKKIEKWLEKNIVCEFYTCEKHQSVNQNVKKFVDAMIQ